ncbi:MULTISPECIES: hypothetical protein [Bacillus]|uniref:hypothetical protein n=1 Tax=Bacillus TaxID=1386 RepID=UPI00031C16B5|nr:MULTISPECIES: hypothetical protein [Bacillus]
MKHIVLIDFVDKESEVYLASGSFFESINVDRVKELEKMGFIKANEELSTLEVKEEKKTVKRTRKKASEANVGED